MYKCPKCGSTNLLTEKKPNGDSHCKNCRHVDKSINFWVTPFEPATPAETYRPLPDSLTIKNSDINGLGLFAKKRILMGTPFGMTHRVLETGQLLRTPLGGFYNHSDEPNCMKHEEGHAYYLVSIKNIEAGEELTVDYTFYKIQKPEQIIIQSGRRGGKTTELAMTEAMNKWLGNNGTDDNENSFRGGWLCKLNGGDEVFHKKAFGYTRDFEAGYDAAKNYIQESL